MQKSSSWNTFKHHIRMMYIIWRKLILEIETSNTTFSFLYHCNYVGHQIVTESRLEHWIMRIIIYPTKQIEICEKLRTGQTLFELFAKRRIYTMDARDGFARCNTDDQVMIIEWIRCTINTGWMVNMNDLQGELTGFKKLFFLQWMVYERLSCNGSIHTSLRFMMYNYYCIAFNVCP